MSSRSRFTFLTARPSLLIAPAAVASLLALLIWRSAAPPPEAAQKLADTTRPTLVAPTVQTASGSNATASYVGSSVCAGCHSHEHQSYLMTAHSRAMGPADPQHEPPDADFYHALSGRTYSVYRKDGQLWHRESLAPSQAAGDSPLSAEETTSSDARVPHEDLIAEYPLTYLVGSGRHSRTYLVEEEGFLMESPVTWYTSLKKWSMSPGYDRAGHSGFERAADEGCLICHVGQLQPIDGALHRLKIAETAIGCERCHGPGSLHVDRRKSQPAAAPAKNAGQTRTASDDSIIHPGRLSRELQESICAQCHLRGDATVLRSGKSVRDFQPGHRLSEFRIDYLLEDVHGQMKVVGHVDQMHASRCYQASDHLTCTTCHNAHSESPSSNDRVTTHHACAQCHSNQGCGLSLAKRTQQVTQPRADDCVLCHMPQVDTDIPHIAFTHHRIGIHTSEPSSKPDGPAAGRLIPFDPEHGMSEIETQRCLALAYVELSSRQSEPHLAETYRRQAIGILSELAANGQADGDVYATLARFTWEDNQSRQALRFAEQAIGSAELSPGARANALLVAASCYLEFGDSQAALAPLNQLVTLRRLSEDWFLLGIARFQAGQRQSGIAALQTASSIQPFRSDVHATLSRMYRTISDPAKAELHLQHAERLNGAR